VQFSEDEDAPHQAPELIGIGERNSAADADVLGRVLLEQVANHPNESAQHKPEERGARSREVMPQSCRSAVTQRERKHRDQFTDREKGYE
jgi:hypothetical protein